MYLKMTWVSWDNNQFRWPISITCSSLFKTRWPNLLMSLACSARRTISNTEKLRVVSLLWVSTESTRQPKSCLPSPQNLILCTSQSCAEVGFSILSSTWKTMKSWSKETSMLIQAAKWRSSCSSMHSSWPKFISMCNSRWRVWAMPAMATSLRRKLQSSTG